MRAIPALVSYNDPCRTGNPMRTLLWKLLLIFTGLVVALLVGLILFLAWRAPRGTWRSRLWVRTLGWLVSMAGTVFTASQCSGVGQGGEVPGDVRDVYGYPDVQGTCYLGRGEFVEVDFLKIEPPQPKHGDLIKVSGVVWAREQVLYDGPTYEIPVREVTVKVEPAWGDPCTPAAQSVPAVAIDGAFDEPKEAFEATVETSDIGCDRVRLVVYAVIGKGGAELAASSYNGDTAEITFVDPAVSPELPDTVEDSEADVAPADEGGSEPAPESPEPLED
jgi:hypothetical protein